MTTALLAMLCTLFCQPAGGSEPLGGWDLYKQEAPKEVLRRFSTRAYTLNCRPPEIDAASKAARGLAQIDTLDRFQKAANRVSQQGEAMAKDAADCRWEVEFALKGRDEKLSVDKNYDRLEATFIDRVETMDALKQRLDQADHNPDSARYREAALLLVSADKAHWDAKDDLKVLSDARGDLHAAFAKVSSAEKKLAEAAFALANEVGTLARPVAVPRISRHAKEATEAADAFASALAGFNAAYAKFLELGDAVDAYLSGSSDPGLEPPSKGKLQARIDTYLSRADILLTESEMPEIFGDSRAKISDMKEALERAGGPLEFFQPRSVKEGLKKKN